MTVKQKKQKSKRELWIILGIVAALILIIAVISILPEPAADESPYVLSDGTTVSKVRAQTAAMVGHCSAWRLFALTALVCILFAD